MQTLKPCLLLLLFVVCSATARKHQIVEDEQIKMQVINHFPCKAADSWSEKIRFPRATEAKLTADPANPGCYKLGGDIKVISSVSGNMQFHLQLSHSNGNSFEVDECTRYNPETGCGGVGSCLYCDECDNFVGEQEERNRTAGLGLWITVDGKRVDCSEAFQLNKNKNGGGSPRRPPPRGNSRVNDRLAALGGIKPRETGTYLHICMPTKEQFLNAQGIAKDIWNELKSDKDSRSQSAVPKKVGVFMVIRFFDSDVSSQLKRQYDFIEFYKRSNSGKAPPYVSGLGFNKMILNNQGFIGCHRILANLYL